MKPLSLFHSCVVVFCLIVAETGCEYVAPDISKAISEKEQHAVQIIQTDIERRTAEALERIAVSLEKIETRLSKGPRE